MPASITAIPPTAAALEASQANLVIGSGALRAGLRLSSVPALTEGTVADAVRFDQAAFPVRVLVRSCNFGDSSLLAELGAAGDGAGGA